jgi:hypothetical protein
MTPLAEAGATLLDGVLCGTHSLAICALKAQARAFGNSESAIWVPVAEVGKS